MGTHIFLCLRSIPKPNVGLDSSSSLYDDTDFFVIAGNPLSVFSGLTGPVIAPIIIIGFELL